MLSTKYSAPEGLIRLRSTARVASHALLLLAFAVIVACLFPPPMHAQGSLSLGTIAVSNVAWSCDPTGGWYYYRNSNGNTYMTCQNAVINCPNTQNISLSFGVIDPTAVGLVSKTLGTVVILGGDGGVAPGNFGFADSFFRAGYEIVEMTWAADWEQTYMPFTQGETASIQNAACRPATFLNFAYTTLFPSVQSANSRAGFCAHGASAGSAEIAYSLAYYGAGSWLD
ncbi:MAG TPA: hypothetical protein VE377_09905 [Candidatus Dormibacteraeota bacterium]|nr:hypothetical protein [Candidatus Dormibacteraeota bacterium]